MSDDIAIKVDNVSKTFKLPHEKNNSIKGAVVNFYKRNKSYEKQQVLKDISFEVNKGEFFGIVGRNGSGKSTLLKLLSGIYLPSKGKITRKGNLTPFIELGVGFNPELTGRENVFLNGALLGFSRKEMRVLYDGIVKFAELENFMDQKLKNYSSGMQVRLAFSIAIQVQSDILVLDEVLAVGDEAFQKKCIAVFDQYKKNKQTVILVTHDMETVKKYCTKAILINDGSIVQKGSPQKVASAYSKLNQSNEHLKGKPDDSASNDLTVSLLDDKKVFSYGDMLRVHLAWVPSGVETAGVSIYSSRGDYVYGTNTDIDDFKVRNKKEVTYNAQLKLGAGTYFIMAGTFKGNDHEIVDFISEGPYFEVKEDANFKGEGLTRLKHEWIL